MLDDLGEFSINFNGWSTDFQVVRLAELDGVRSRSGTPARVGDIPRGLAHGSVPGPMFLGDRVISATVHVVGNAAVIEQEVSAMESAFTVLSDALPLTWTIRDVSRQADVRVTNVDLPVSKKYALGVARAVIQFVATDPRVYAAGDPQVTPGTPGLHIKQTGVGSVSGGLGMPHGMPHGFGDVDPGTLPVWNLGNTPAPWTATITGPIVAPSITLESTGDRLSWSTLTVAAGQTLEVDTRTRTAKLDGTAPRFPAPDRDWFEIPSGIDAIAFGAASGTGTLKVTWRDTWL